MSNDQPESMTVAERSKYVFIVKEDGSGNPFIELSGDPELQCIGDGQLILELVESTSYEDAQQLARMLRTTVAKLAHVRTVRASGVQQRPF